MKKIPVLSMLILHERLEGVRDFQSPFVVDHTAPTIVFVGRGAIWGTDASVGQPFFEWVTGVVLMKGTFDMKTGVFLVTTKTITETAQMMRTAASTAIFLRIPRFYNTLVAPDRIRRIGPRTFARPSCKRSAPPQPLSTNGARRRPCQA